MDPVDDVDVRMALARALQVLQERTGSSLVGIMPRAQVNLLKGAKRDPKLTTLVRIARYQGISVQTLGAEIDNFLPMEDDRWKSSFCDYTLLADGILLVMMRGTLTAKTAVSVMMEVYTEAQIRGVNKILINLLGMHLDLSNHDRMDLGERVADWLEEHDYRPKIAVVVLARGITGRVMRARAIDTQTLSSQPEALEWLRKKPDDSILIVPEIFGSLRKLADASPFMHWIANTERKCLHVNEQLLNFTGMERNDFLGDGWKRCYHPADWPQESRNGLAYDELRAYYFSYRMRKADGNYGQVMQLAAPHFSGEVFVGFFGTLIPIGDEGRLRSEKGENQ